MELYNLLSEALLGQKTRSSTTARSRATNKIRNSSSHNVKAGSSILGTAQIGGGTKTIMPLVVAVSNSIERDIAEKLGRDFQVYKLQMAVQSLTGVMINEMVEAGIKIDKDTVKLVEVEAADIIDKELNSEEFLDEAVLVQSGGRGDSSIKNVYTLKPSWTKIQIPIANMEIVDNMQKATPGFEEENTQTDGSDSETTNSRGTRESNGGPRSITRNNGKMTFTGGDTETNETGFKTSVRNSSGNKNTRRDNIDNIETSERGDRIGRIDQIQITLATQAIGFGIDGKTLAYSFLGQLDKRVRADFNANFKKSFATLRRWFDKTIKSKVLKSIKNTVVEFASGLENVYLNFKSIFSSSAKKELFNKRDAAIKLEEVMRFAGFNFPTIILDSEDLAGLQITSALISKYSDRVDTNIIVYDKNKRSVKMYVQDITIFGQGNNASYDVGKGMEDIGNTVRSTPIIIEYPDSQLGRYRYLSSVDVF